MVRSKINTAYTIVLARNFPSDSISKDMFIAERLKLLCVYFQDRVSSAEAFVTRNSEISWMDEGRCKVMTGILVRIYDTFMFIFRIQVHLIVGRR